MALVLEKQKMQKKMEINKNNYHTKDHGFVHLYTGDGKGKTTAALGLALRAVGAGKKVYIAQFVKGMHYSELNALIRFPEIELKQFGLDCFIINEPNLKDIDAAQNGLIQVSEVIIQNHFNLVSLDELCIALHYHLVDILDVVNILKLKPADQEIIITGRYAPKELYQIADLITEMKEVKHYYKMGTEARKGIEY